MKKLQRELSPQAQLARGPVDLPFLMLTVMLLAMGLITMFSASYASAYYDAGTGNDPLFYIASQAKYAASGLFAMYCISKIDYQTLRTLAVPGIIGAVILLVLVYTPLGVSKKGARRWLNLIVQFQPSEVAKVAVILFFAARLSKRDGRKPLKFSKRTTSGRMLNFLERIGFLELIPYGLILGIVALLVVKQPHMSGTILIVAGAAAVVFAAGIKLGWFVGAAVAMAGALAFVITSTDYMSRRVEIWQNPWNDPTGDGFQTIQSLYSIASGGAFGVGFGQSKQKFGYVPEPENDFVFPIAVEEMGFVGAVVIIILFVLLILRGYWIAMHARDRFGMLTIVGIITLLSVQVFLNLAVVTNLIPPTGISLPFFSFGGTALLVQLGQMGIVLSISRQIPPPRQD